MKKISLILSAILILSVTVFCFQAYAGDVTTPIDTIWTEKEQREDFFTARAALENLTNVLLEELMRFNEIKQSGTFDTIPADLKNAMLRWETAYKDVKAALLADQEIVDIYNWRP